MKNLTSNATFTVSLALMLSVFATHAIAAEARQPRPKDRVVAMYFHRTQRCPTCLKMGSYTEEAIKTGFADPLRDRSVEFYYIDFQKDKNSAYTKAYKITGPALIVAKVTDNKVTEFKDLKKIWSHVGDKKAFLKYVQGHVTAYLEQDAAE